MELKRCKDEHGIIVQCVECRKLRPLSRCYADLEGEPFVDYYCLECVKQLETGESDE